jgi:hypothetical protein
MTQTRSLTIWTMHLRCDITFLFFVLLSYHGFDYCFSNL